MTSVRKLRPSDGRRAIVGVVVAALAVGSLGGVPAYAVGGVPAADGAYPFVAKIDIGGERACSGALVAPQWVVTARACFASGAQPVLLGPPAKPTTATVGRTNLAGAAGHVVPVVQLTPHPDRDVVLAKLATRIPDVTPVPVGATAPAIGDVLRIAGYGRTSDEWVPDRLHTATSTVTAVAASTFDIVGADPKPASPCRGDAGGPALREGAGVTQLVALHHTSWQRGCLGEPADAPPGATETRLDDLAGWIRQSVADVALYGVLPDRRLTYSTIDAATGDLLTTVTSTQALGFTPRALVTLNANTLLVTKAGEFGELYRVDITANNPRLEFAAPVQIAAGYTQDRLTYDGNGSLFGILHEAATGLHHLRRYTVTSAKPTGTNLIYNTKSVGNFALKTVTGTGPDWLLGTTAAGKLLSYHFNVQGVWTLHELEAAGWGGLTHLVSPGGGLYYGRTANGALHRYRDAAPFDNKGGDIQKFPTDPVSTSGWNQTLLSAQPLTAYPQNPLDVAMYGALDDGRLTYSAIDSATGDRLTTVTSTQNLGFKPKTLIGYNFNTLLVTSDAGHLYRVDLLASNPLMFAPPVQIGTDFDHQLLTYDGDGMLFGIKGGRLTRNSVTGAKPAAANVAPVGASIRGFTLTTLAATGPDWIIGTTSAGVLRGYHILPDGNFEPADLALSGWGDVTHLTSPGNGVYYARTKTGALLRYRDAAPFDGKGTDIASFPTDPVDASGWTQVALAAQPFSS